MHPLKKVFRVTTPQDGARTQPGNKLLGRDATWKDTTWKDTTKKILILEKTQPGRDATREAKNIFRLVTKGV